MKKLLAIMTIIMVTSIVLIGCSKDNVTDEDQIKNENPDTGNETKPDEEPEEKPEEKPEEVNVAVKDILEAIKEQMKEDLIAEGVPEENFQDGMIPGFMEQDLKPEVEDENAFFVLEINPEDLEEGYMLAQMINIKSDQIIVLKASSAEAVGNLQAVLEQAKEAQIATWEQYLPDQYEKVKNNIIKTNGNYLLYVTYDQPETIEDIFDDMLK